jgi:general secretion pathway protein H
MKAGYRLQASNYGSGQPALPKSEACSLKPQSVVRLRSRRGGAQPLLRSDGLTLVEMLIVLLIVTLLLAGVVMGTGQLAGAKLHKSATALTGLVRVAYVRATVTARNERIVFDLDTSKFWLEESEQPMLVQKGDKTGTGGADPVTAAERQAVDEGSRLVKGPQAPRPTFRMVKPGLYAASDNQGGSDQSLPFGIKFRAVQTGHDADARTKGRAYLYFWPGGLTERASIVLRKGDSLADNDAMTLIVSPLTGTTKIKAGNVSLPVVTDDKDLSEREDRAAP